MRELEPGKPNGEYGLGLAYARQGRSTEAIAASNDCGDLSWVVPMGRLWFPGTVPDISFHHWTGGAPPYVVERRDGLPLGQWSGVLTTSVQNASAPVSADAAYFRVRGN